MSDTIYRQQAIDGLTADTKKLLLFHNDKESGMAIRYSDAVEMLSALPPAQPSREVIDECIYNIKANLSVHTSSWAMVEINYYIDKLYEEIFGKANKPKRGESE